MILLLPLTELWKVCCKCCWVVWNYIAKFVLLVGIVPTAVCISREGHLLATAGADGVVKISFFSPTPRVVTLFDCIKYGTMKVETVLRRVMATLQRSQS